MHRKIQISMFLIFLIFCSAALSPLKAEASDLYCYLVANTVDVRVEVWENDRQGNKGQLIWRGTIRQGQRQKINTRFGRIRYASTVYQNTTNATSGDVNRWCERGSTIGVP